ncbi:MAG: hypothetical protein ACLFPT_23950, partial [Ralstonia sp.]
MTQHVAIRTGLDVQGHQRERWREAVRVLAITLPLLSSPAWAQSPPSVAALQELSPLARMLVGAATGR